jgi:hypothetical protein
MNFLNSFTACLWIKFNTINISNQYFLEFSATVSGISYVFYLNADNTLTIRNRSADNLDVSLTTVATLAANKWYHLTAILNGYSQLIYINGVLSAGPSVCNTIGILYSNPRIGGSTTLPRVLVDGVIDDLRIYNTALTAAQVQAIYTAQGMPSRVESQIKTQNISFTFGGTPLFSQLSSTATSSAVGAFSLRAVNGTTVKAVQVKRSSDNATQDFWADRLGNLLTAPVTGQSLANWLGSATGNVVTWYDQSGAGNHATQATAANQPVIQRATKGPGYSCLFNGIANYVSATTSSNIYDNTNYSVCAICRRTALGPSQEFYTGSNGNSIATNSKIGFGYYNSGTQLQIGVYNAVYFGPNVPVYSAGSEPMGYDYFTFSTTLGSKIYSWRNSTAYSRLNSTTTTPQNLSGPSVDIGRGQGGSYFIGEIYEIIIFRNSLYQTGGDSLVTQIYQNQLSQYGT